MSFAKFSIFCLIFVSFSAKSEENECSAGHAKQIFCYYLSGAVENSSFYQNFHSWPLPPCTHIIFAFAKLDIDGNVVLSTDAGNEMKISSEVHELIRLKERHACLKVLIAVGGYDEGSEKFSSLAETEKSIEIFSEKVLRFLIFHGLDGIDIHWMYPTMRGGIAEDRKNFVKLLKVLKQKLAKRNKLVVAAIGGTSSVIKRAYSPLKELCDALDYAILLTFDYAERYKTSIAAPLLQDTEIRHRETVAGSVDEILSENCDKAKIIMGVSTYAKAYRLKLGTRKHLHAAAVEMNENSVQSGVVEYEKVCTAIQRNESLTGKRHNIHWTVKKMSRSHSKFAYHDKTWISFDDHEAVEAKTRFALTKDLAGLMFFTLNGDGNCRLHYSLVHSSVSIIDDFHANCRDLPLPECVAKVSQSHNFAINLE